MAVESEDNKNVVRSFHLSPDLSSTDSERELPGQLYRWTQGDIEQPRDWGGGEGALSPGTSFPAIDG